MAHSKALVDSNPSKKQAIEEWVYTNIDYKQMKQGFPICFFRNTSFFLTELPGLRHLSQDAKMQLLEAIVDRDMQEDLQAAGLINWCRNVSSVLPIRVPKDGNCLLHSMATAVWGIHDDRLLLRRLLNVALQTDKDRRFNSRWARHRQGQISQVAGSTHDSNTESLHQEWMEVCGCLDPDRPASFAVPHRFLESIHVYTLANIFRRPIIVLTDSSVRAFSGLSLQDNDMGGIYLPLEWDWSDTCRTPVLLAYAQNHFCPLLFVDRPEKTSSPSARRKNLTPLVTGKLEQLPVRLLLVGEEPEVGELLKKYLRVKETVMSLDGSIHTILCAEFETSRLPDDLDLVSDLFRQYSQSYSHSGSYLLHQTEVPLQPQASAALMFEHFQQAGNQNQSASSPQQIRREHPPSALAETPQHWTQHSHSFGTRQVPLDIPPPNMVPPQRNFPHSQESSLNPSPSRKCIVPDCKYYGDPSLGMMCSTCFNQYTITESRRMAAALEFERQKPTAPLPSIGAEEEEEYQMSMMAERCQKGCGYRCSRKTYPYCHECAEKLRREAQEKTRAEERSEATGAGAAAAGCAVPIETNSASMAGLAAQSSSAPAAVAQNAASSRNPLLEPFVTLSSLAATGPARRNWAQQDLMQFPSLAGKPTEAPVAMSQATATVTSPAQVLDKISLTVPLTPPDDTSDKDLFSGGCPSPTTSGQPLGTTTTHTVATSGNNNLSGGPTKFTPMNNLSEQEKTLPAASWTCITVGCSDEPVQQNRCGRCYIGMGLKQDQDTPQKLQQMTSGHNSVTFGRANLEPKPSSFMQNKEMQNLTNPQQGSQPSSFPQPPNSNPPLNASKHYVPNWLQASGQQASNQAMGLPERQGDDLGEQDLVPSGEACHTSGIKCVSQVCNNQVTQPGQLCQQCQGILRSASQSQVPTSPVQESLPGDRQKCPEENCTYFGAQRTCGYCSEHYEKHFKRQLAEETRRNHPANTSHTIPLSRHQHFINMTPDLRPMTAPLGRLGKRCKMPGCTFFGDPKQKDMCGKHYQEYVSSIASGSNVRVTYPGPSSYIQSATVVKPLSPGVILMGTPEMGTNNYVQGALSVPPPSIPIAESGPPGSPRLGQMAIGQSRSLDETYTRVATRNVQRCSQPTCQNYGNSSKGGFCNSCFENQELVRQAILGDEECG